jgi:hypothetical protein
MQTEEKRHYCGSINTAWHDHHRKGESHRILRPQKPLDASRMVSRWWPVSIAICLKTHRKAETPLGTISTGRLVNRISCRSRIWIQHARNRHRYDRLAHHACKPRGFVCIKAYSRPDTNGRNIQPQQDIRLCWWHGMYAERLSKAGN